MLWRSEIIKVFATATTLCSPGTINIGHSMIRCYCDRPMLWKLKECNVGLVLRANKKHIPLTRFFLIYKIVSFCSHTAMIKKYQILICLSQKCYVVSKTLPTPDICKKEKFPAIQQLPLKLGMLPTNWWHSGAGARTKGLCRSKGSFSPTCKLWEFEFEHGTYLFTCGQM